jgi:hypothetical protein
MRFTTALAVLLMVAITAASTLHAQTEDHRIYLPRVVYRSLTPNRLGADLRVSAPDVAIAPLVALQPAWVRAGDVDWAFVEKQPGTYTWEELAAFEVNVARVRQAGLTPTAVLMRAPEWATAVSGRVCAPPLPEAIDDLERFAEAVARRYASGPLQVDIWQFGNEVDFRPEHIPDVLGSGCWGTTVAPYYGGDYYGQVLTRVAAAIRRGNPNAFILAGGLVYPEPFETETLGFVRGMLVAGSGLSFNALSFTGYGIRGINDVMVIRARGLRSVLAEFHMERKPLVAAEVGRPCIGPQICPPAYEQIQAEYAARIYAEAIAADIDIISWFTFIRTSPDPEQTGLLEPGSGAVIRLPYYALRNSALLLHDARVPGVPFAGFDPNTSEPLVLTFPTSRGLIYVVWEPRDDRSPYVWIPVPPGAQALCTDRFDTPTPQTYDCTGQTSNGALVFRVTSTRYIEIVSP